MITSPKITTTADITLVTLQNCPSELKFVAGVFEKIGSLGVDVDMISLAPSHGAFTSISFTISDADLVKILNFTAEVREKGNVKAIVSSGNNKISVYDEGMKQLPGVAAEVFKAAASSGADIRLITTSEVDISLLVTAADFAEALKAIKNRFQAS